MATTTNTAACDMATGAQRAVIADTPWVADCDGGDESAQPMWTVCDAFGIPFCFTTDARRARMVAAAPDLLHVLEHAILCLDADVPVSVMSVLDIAGRAVIRKAKGE